MRLDVALKYLCLVKSRSTAKNLCARGAVLINDKPAKPSSPLQRGDLVTIDLSRRILSVRILDIPDKQLSKKESPTYYETVADDGRGDVL